MKIDWTKATIKVSAPVEHTATTDIQEFTLTLEQFSAMVFDAQSASVRREMARKAVKRINDLRETGTEQP